MQMMAISRICSSTASQSTGIAWDTALKYTVVNVELLSDTDIK